jgi:cysteine desulfurase
MWLNNYKTIAMNNIKRIYLDNAATTAVDEEVLQAMMPYLTSQYGNPSSIHHLGREARIAIEESRKKIATLLGVKPKNIIFTSCGTESNNTAILSALRDLECDHIITSKIEHHAVLHTVEHYAAEFGVDISYVQLDEDGCVDQNDLRRLLDKYWAAKKKCLVTLMHANNETGQFTRIRWISNLCKKYNAIFHSDCVQTIGHYPLNLQVEAVHMASASAHKFYGPKGVGFLYVHDDIKIGSLLYGGGQERNLRAGTENVAYIAGMAKALELAYKEYSKEQEHIAGLKSYLATFLKTYFPGCIINSGRFSLYSVLSVSFPKTEKNDFLLMELDQKGICVSGGSACSGGGSHVMKELGKAEDYVTIRFSFSKHNSKAEVDKVLEALQGILEVNTPAIHNS